MADLLTPTSFTGRFRSASENDRSRFGNLFRTSNSLTRLSPADASRAREERDTNE